MYVSEATKITLTIGQIRRLVQEVVLKNGEGGFTEQELLQSLIVSDGDDIDESIRSVLALTLIASAFAVGNIIRADDIKANVARAKTPQQVQRAINQASKKTYGGFSAAQATNIVMRTLYYEGRGEIPEGRKMIANVIWNRAGGDPARMPGVCLKKFQFSVWNGITNSERTPSGFSVKVPPSVMSNTKEMEVWNDCKGLVDSLFNGTFESVGNYNSYLNVDKSDPKNVTGWGAKMTNQKVVGHNTFGYLREKDGFRKASKVTQTPKQQYIQTYKVKAGDRGVSFIAKDLISSGQTKYSNARDLTNEIIRINKFKTDRNGNPIIHVGDIIKLPA